MCVTKGINLNAKDDDGLSPWDLNDQPWDPKEPKPNGSYKPILDNQRNIKKILYEAGANFSWSDEMKEVQKWVFEVILIK